MKRKAEKFLSASRRKRLNNTDFTIISNNCWGGVCYEYFGLPKLSPTVGMYFFAEDYIKFLENFAYYMTKDIDIINGIDSKHADELKKLNQLSYPIGRLGSDIEIIFLHYNNPEIAKEKWMRRIKRINYNNLIFKFSNMNQCTPYLMKRFSDMDLPGKKIMFVNRLEDIEKYSCAVYYPGYEEDEQIDNDTYYWCKYFDVISLLNK